MPPLAIVVTPKNFAQEVSKSKGRVALDVWSEETLDCRYHSVLWDDLGLTDKVILKKLDAGKYPKLAGRLGVAKLPTFLFLKDGQEVGRREGYLYLGDKAALVKQMTACLNK